MHCSGLSSTAFKLLKSNSEIDSNASISMQQGINIATDFLKKNRAFHFVWIVSVDCLTLSVSASFLALNALKLMASFSIASFGSSLGLAFELNALDAIHGFASFL